MGQASFNANLAIKIARLALAPSRPRTWFAVEGLARCATGRLSDTEALTVGLVVVSLALGLRVGEAGALRADDFWLPASPEDGHIRVQPEKQRPSNLGCVYRHPPPFRPLLGRLHPEALFGQAHRPLCPPLHPCRQLSAPTTHRRSPP